MRAGFSEKTIDNWATDALTRQTHGYSVDVRSTSSRITS